MCVSVSVFVLTAIKIDAPSSALPFCLYVWSFSHVCLEKRVFSLYELVENIVVLSFCVTVLVPPECGLPYVPSHCGEFSSLRHILRVTPAPEEDLFTCYAGRSRLSVPMVSLWQQAVGRHFPRLRCWWQALGCTGGCRSPA